MNLAKKVRKYLLRRYFLIKLENNNKNKQKENNNQLDKNNQPDNNDYVFDVSIIKKAKDGDNASIEKIFEKNINLIWHIINRLNMINNNVSCDKNDLFQIGTIGLIKAIKNFDTTKNVKFSTFAFTYIFGEIKMFLREDGIIKVSRDIKKNSILISKLKEEYDKKNIKLKISDIKKITNLTEDDISLALGVTQSIYSLDDGVSCFNKNSSKVFDNNSKEGKNVDVSSSIASKTNVEDDTIKKIMIKEMLKKLSKDERVVIILRYFKDKKQDEISSVMNLSQVKISRLEKRALGKLKLLVT